MHILSRLELRVLLRTVGYSQAHFARYIGRSPAFVSELCRPYDHPVPFRWAEKAYEMIGPAVYDDALAQARAYIDSVRARGARPY